MERNIILVCLLVLCCCSVFGQEILIGEYESLAFKSSSETGTAYSQIIDVKSKEIVLDSIDRIEPDKGLFKVYKQGKVGFYGLGGGIQIEPKYDAVEYIRYGRHGYLVMTINNKKGLYSLFDTPKMALDIQYDEISFFRFPNSDYIIMEKNGKKGVYSVKENQLYVDTLYDDIEFSGGYILLSKNNKQGALNKEGEIVFEVKYDNVYWNRVLLVAERGSEKEFY
ncbi:MAG: WG repeat-containing protein, partial [Flavobacterium sp.]